MFHVKQFVKQKNVSRETLEVLNIELNKIMKAINVRLAGENLMYSQAVDFMDAVIDDINAELNARYPVFTEFTEDEYPSFPDYCFFPDKYIRSVIIPGVVFKFYTTDEEGIQAAPQFRYDYIDALYKMKRDYSIHVPSAYQDCDYNGTLDECNHQEYRDWIGGVYDDVL